MIPIYEPYFTKANLKYAHEALDSGWVSSQGKYLDLVKTDIKNKFGYKFVILTNNGTTASHLMAVALKFKHPHIKKIIVPNNVYIAAWNSFLYDKNYKLIPVDADLDTWNFDTSKIHELIDDETAILVVHNVGNVVNVPLLKVQFPNTVILEDNCEGFLGKYENIYTGNSSFVSSVSFFGNKTLTSGEGGAFMTSDRDVFEHINVVKNQGQSNTKFVHHVMGYNYRMTNVQAAILYGQLLDLDDIIFHKNRVFQQYKTELIDLQNKVSFQQTDLNTNHSHWMVGIKLDGLINKTKLELELFNNGIDLRPMFYDINSHGFLKDIPCDTTNAKILNSRCLMLPSSPMLTESQISFVCERIKSSV